MENYIIEIAYHIGVAVGLGDLEVPEFMEQEVFIAICTDLAAQFWNSSDVGFEEFMKDVNLQDWINAYADPNKETDHPNEWKDAANFEK